MQGLSGYLLPLLFIVYKSFNIYYSVWVFVFLFSGGLGIGLRCQIIKLAKGLICLSNDWFSYCFLHQVNFTLSYQFHVSVSKRYQHFLCLVCSPSVASSRNTCNLFCRRENKERIRLHTEVEVLSEWRTNQELYIRFNFEQVVLLLPNKRHYLELSQTVLLWRCWPVLLSWHVVENKLLSPLNDALNNIQTQHTQGVQNVDTFVQQCRLNLTLRVNFLKHSSQLMNLRKTRLTCYNSANSKLNRRLLTL